jgi:hypothetical protein
MILEEAYEGVGKGSLRLDVRGFPVTAPGRIAWTLRPRPRRQLVPDPDTGKVHDQFLVRIRGVEVG